MGRLDLAQIAQTRGVDLSTWPPRYDHSYRPAAEEPDWLNQYDATYHDLTATDFVERDIKVVIFDPDKWGNIAEHFIQKKLHNIANNKEIGAIGVMVEHWGAGSRDVYLSMRHKDWLERPQNGETMVTYDLTGDGTETLNNEQEK